MENLSAIIGKNLYDIRKKKNLSLDKVAEMTGVSKPMLGQIERGVSNPSVTILWKIATGLNVSFSYFIEGKEEPIRYVPLNSIRPLHEEENAMAAYPIFPYDEKRRFEIFTISLQPNCCHPSSPHNPGVEEYIIVSEGELHVTIEENQYRLEKGDALSFPGNKPHIYQNSSSQITVFTNLIVYLP